jgi:C1A family cysteine protease
MGFKNFIQHIFNVVKDQPDSRDSVLRSVPAAVASSLPTSADLTPWTGTVKNQGPLGACTAHAVTSMRELLYKKYYQFEKDQAADPKTFRLSPLYQYAIERQLEGDFNVDNGAQSRSMFLALTQFGGLLESEDPYDPKNVFSVPSITQINKAAYQHVSYHRVLTVDDARSVLASGYPLTVGMPVFESFESDAVAASGLVPVPGLEEKNVGGHELLVVAYDDVKKAFKLQNSYGPGWGLAGFCWLPYAYFDSPLVNGGYDLWTAHLGKPW